MIFRRLIRSPRRRAAEIDVDNSTPNHLNIHVSERDYDINPRFSAFIGFVLHGYAHNNFRIFCARLRPFALNNFRFFDFSKQALHEYPSDKRPRGRPRRREAWLRIFVVRCGLPCDHSAWGSFMPWRDDTTLLSRGLWLRPIGKSSECCRMTVRTGKAQRGKMFSGRQLFANAAIAATRGSRASACDLRVDRNRESSGWASCS
jgi:hypothetical protein